MLKLKAPAKINWFLLVRGKRTDGYHEIESMMQCVGLYDTLAFEPLPSEVEVITGAEIPLEKNLVYRAAVLLRERAGKRRGARITLDKQIPMAAGLGGGSSDAAYTLRGLSQLWEIKLPEPELHAMAASLGSDVPFFLGAEATPSAFVHGRGEHVEPLRQGVSCTLLMLKPSLGISTAWAYGQVRKYTETGVDLQAIHKAMELGDIWSIKSFVKNDLEPPVFESNPRLRAMKEELARSGALIAAMSGSGPTLYAVYPSEAQALRAFESLSFRADEGLWHAVVHTL